MGAGVSSDAFLIAWTIPNVFRRFVADEGLTGAMIPALSQAEADGEDPKALARSILTALLIANGLLIVGGVLGAEWVVALFAPKWVDQPEKFDLAVSLTRWMFPFIAMVSLVSFYEGLLNQRGHFFVPKVAPGVVSAGIVVALLFFSGGASEPAYVAAAGVMVGGVVHVLINLPVTVQRWGAIWPGAGLNEPRFKGVMVELGKVVAIGVFAQINIVVLRQIATSLDAGSVTWYHNATRIVDLAQGVIAVAIGSALLPQVSAAVAEQDWARFRSDMVGAIRLACFLIFPAAAVLYAFATPVTSMLFRLGAYSEQDVAITAATTALLLPYMLGLAGLNIYKKVFFALNDRGTLLNVGAFGVLLTGALGFWLVQDRGVAGLAMALSLSTCCQLLLYVGLLWRRLGPRLGLAELTAPLFKMAVASLPVVLLLQAVAPLGDWAQGPLHLTNVAVLFGGLGAAAALYLIVARLMSLRELDTVLKHLGAGR
jgi:putative peptidoglycan lipid II flippase